jgi:plasmid stabilization system protein ParE
VTIVVLVLGRAEENHNRRRGLQGGTFDARFDWPTLSDDSLKKRRITMTRGDKSKYTDKQKRQAEHIEEGYEERGVSEKEAERRAWATVNKMTGGGKKAGSGRGKRVNTAPARKGGRLGGAAAAARPAAARSASAKKAAQTRARRKQESA